MNIWTDILDIGMRTSVVYIMIVMGLLLLGRKELSQMSIADLVFILLISNSVQNAMVGSNTSLLGGLMAALVLFLLNFIFRFLNYKVSFFRKLVEGEPVLLIYDGKVNEKNLMRESITMDELMAAVREHGVERIEDVSLSMIEIDGNISVVSDDIKKKTKHKRRKHIKGFLR